MPASAKYYVGRYGRVATTLRRLRKCSRASVSKAGRRGFISQFCPIRVRRHLYNSYTSSSQGVPTLGNGRVFYNSYDGSGKVSFMIVGLVFSPCRGFFVRVRTSGNYVRRGFRANVHYFLRRLLPSRGASSFYLVFL